VCYLMHNKKEKTMESIFAILGFVFGTTGFALAIVCLVKMQKLETFLIEKGIFKEN
jgi:type IV secretory pathway component VirB8